MSSNLDYKVFDGSKQMIGSVMHAEDAAALVSLHTDGTVKWKHAVTVWREGKEEQSAGDSYDSAAAVMYERVDAYNRKRYARLTAGYER